MSNGPYENIDTEQLEKLKQQIEDNDLDGAIFNIKNTATNNYNELDPLNYDKLKQILKTLETKIKQPSIDGINKLFNESSSKLSKSELKFTEDYLNQIEGITNIQFILTFLSTPELETYFSNKIKEIEDKIEQEQSIFHLN